MKFKTIEQKILKIKKRLRNLLLKNYFSILKIEISKKFMKKKIIMNISLFNKL